MITLYVREIVLYPFTHWKEYYSTEEKANAAYQLRDASRDIYVHDGGTIQVSNESLEYDIIGYGRYNNTPAQLKNKILWG